MAVTWPPKNSDEMLALQQEYGRDDEIAAALGVPESNVTSCRRAYNLPIVPKTSLEIFKARKNLGEAKIAELYAGKRYR